jgi:DNA-binding CsgD family transcriptional regulator
VPSERGHGRPELPAPGVEFDRAGPDFNERDRAVLDLLLPHLKQFRRSAMIRRRPHPPPGRESVVRPREREILEHIAQGRTNAQVASLLLISPDTVRKHLENAYTKLGVHNRTGAVAALFESVSKT